MTPSTQPSKTLHQKSRLWLGWSTFAAASLIGGAAIGWRSWDRSLIEHSEPRATQATAALGAGAATTSRATTAPVFSQSVDVTEGAVGPWGQMQYVPIVLEMPENYATVEQATASRRKWNFAYRSREKAIELLSSFGVTAQQLAMIPASAWQESDSGCVLEPPDELLLDLAPETRAGVYAQLVRDPVNQFAVDPMWFRAGRVDFRLRASGLSDDSISLLKRLLYPGPSNMLLLNDEAVALRAIADPQEQARFFKAIERKRSLMARLLITPDTDTQALANYWGKRGREANLLPLLDSIKFNATAGVENPGRINILSLLPPFAQERLYRHPELNLPEGKLPEDCFWTAFNFFNDVPDDRINEPGYINELIEREYIKIDQPSELGDVLLIADQQGNAIHAANYIADNLVFTKNGLSTTSPWMLSPMRDVIDTYRIRYDPPKTYYFRKVRGGSR
jgi:hypothetical protein